MNTNSFFFGKKLTLGHFLTWRVLLATLFGFATLAAFLWLPSPLFEPAPADTQADKPQAVFVKTIEAIAEDHYKIPIEYTGEVVARRRTDLSFQRSGMVKEIFFDEGDEVKENQVVARLDDRQTRAELKKSNAQVVVAEARYDELEEGPRNERIEAAKASVDELQQQLKNAQLDLERAKTLLPKGAISQQEFDANLFLVKTLDARIASAESNLDELEVGTRKEQLEQALGNLEAARGEAELAEHNLDDCSLRAPFSGTITRRMVDEGAVLTAGMSVFRLVESNHLEVHVGLPNGMVSSLKIGSKVDVIINNETVKATLSRSLSEIDVSNQTQRVILTLPVDSPAVDRQLVRVRFEQTQNVEGFQLPVSAIVNDQRGLWSCYTLVDEGKDKIAKRQSIEVLHFQGDWAYVRGTIAEGDLLIADGLQKIANGMVVKLAPNQEAE